MQSRGTLNQAQRYERRILGRFYLNWQSEAWHMQQERDREGEISMNVLEG